MFAENLTEVASSKTISLLNFYAICTVLVLVSLIIGIIIGIMIQKEKKELEKEFFKNDPETLEEIESKKEFRK
jgi:hypothetical protein